MNNNNNQNISTQEMQDNLYQAMEIITNSIIKDIPYDRTINCTIINDKDKKNGKYTVTNEVQLLPLIVKQNNIM